VVPSVWFENAPSVVLEAFSHGIPVIASRIGGLPEIVTTRSGSRTFAPGDASELADAIVSAWNERPDLAEKRKMARGVYLADFTPERHVSEYLKMVSELSAA
jgi:glycosyltransferase involved in cell wall biosynthesis